jgi:glycerophosphoryl diester phosphodiesterase
VNKKWLIAHRGCQCDGRENTKSAFKATKNYPIDFVELDIHSTKDGVIVCHHDFDISGQKIASLDFNQLKKLDPELTMFDEAIQLCGNVPLIVEVKPTGIGKKIVKTLKTHPNWYIASYKYQALIELADLGIDKKRMFLLQHKHPLFHIKHALKGGFGGIAVYYLYTFIPFYLYFAKKKGLKIYVYSPDSLVFARLSRIFLPYVGVCTNHPDKLQKLKY